MALWKNMVLWKKTFGTIEKSYGTSIYEGKQHGRLPKIINFDLL